MNTCTHPDCGQPKGECARDCLRLMTECVEHNQKGCGIGYAIGLKNGVKTTLHRLVFCEANGVSPDQIKGLVVRHKCDNPRCINPQHLELGTHADNSRDCKERGRRNDKLGSANPSAKMTAEQVAWIRSVCKNYHPKFGQRALAKRFGVSVSAINLIVKRKNWSWT